LADCEPVYETLPSWKEDISGMTEFKQLPKAAQNYVKAIEKWLETPVVIISVGPGREQTIVRKKIF